MKYTECLCHDCPVHDAIEKGESYACGCESGGPVFNAEACGECSQRHRCDVPKNPDQYKD